MTAEQKEAFIHRSIEVFDCDPTIVETTEPTATSSPQPSSPDGHLNLVVGAISSSDVRGVASLMSSLLEKTSGRDDVALKVVLLENGRNDAASRAELTDAVSGASRQGLDVSVITLERQAQDIGAGVFDATPAPMPGRKRVALSRTMLQHYLFGLAKPLPGAVVWVLDDDIVLDGLVSGPDGAIRAEQVDYISAIKRLKQPGSGEVLGEVVGDPPLPVLSCVRTQLVDLYHNLLQLASLNPDDQYPDRLEENRQQRLRAPDYYYDLSGAHTDHLESPFWYEPSDSGMSVRTVLREMASRLPNILHGGQVFRPLVATAPHDPGLAGRTSLSRGPNTLVFDLQALRDFPNAMPTIEDSDARQSDMMWSLLNRYVGGRSVVQARLPVRQQRVADIKADQHIDTLINDIRGHALFSSLRDLLLRKSKERQSQGLIVHSPDLLRFDKSEIEEVVAYYAEYLKERTHAFEMSFLRVKGLLSALRRFCEQSDTADLRPWWLDSSEDSEDVRRLRTFVESPESIYTQENLDLIKRRVLQDDKQAIRHFLRELPGTVAKYRLNTPLPRKELRLAAESFVKSEFRTGDLNCLGIGEEGVVLTDGRMVYKYFHYWHQRVNKDRLDFLQSLAGRLTGYKTLPDMREVRSAGDRLVITYPYEPGRRYEGGSLDQLLTLLRECQEAGIACRNIHPDNLMVTPSGLKLIDFGLDIVPYTEDEFEQMCRRAYLTYRFHYRSDLKLLMTRSLTDSTMPELTGFDLFLRALHPPWTSSSTVQ